MNMFINSFQTHAPEKMFLNLRFPIRKNVNIRANIDMVYGRFKRDITLVCLIKCASEKFGVVI